MFFHPCTMTLYLCCLNAWQVRGAISCWPAHRNKGHRVFEAFKIGSAEPQGYLCAVAAVQDPQLAAVLLGDNMAAMQDLLRSTYQVGAGWGTAG